MVGRHFVFAMKSWRWFFSCLFLSALCCLGTSRNSFSEGLQTEKGKLSDVIESDEDSVPRDENWLDKGQESISQTVSELAHRFDSFWGNSKHEEERDVTHGRIELGVWWDQKDEFDFPTDFWVNLSLPNFEHRLNAFLGRTNEQELIAGTTSEFEGLPSIFQELAKEKDSDEWLLGFGYSPVRDKRNRFDVDAGVNVSSSQLDPFAKIRYRGYVFLGDQALLRLRPTIYWKARDGFGTSLRVDVDRIFSTDFLIRCSNSGHYSETTEGLEWWSALNVFQHLGREKGLMYTVEISGETEAPVDIKDYGAGLLYRQRFFREWLSGSVGGSVKWPQDAPQDERKAVFGVGVRIELRFGQRPEDVESRSRS